MGVGSMPSRSQTTKNRKKLTNCLGNRLLVGERRGDVRDKLKLVSFQSFDNLNIFFKSTFS